MDGEGDPHGSQGFDQDVTDIAALGDPVRRALYREVAVKPGPVSRDEAAAAVGVARHIAKFHLDKLVDAGLLAAEYARPTGRGGPGAGRPAKLYRRSGREVAVTLPARRYELAGRLLAAAVTDAPRNAEPVTEALKHVAKSTGTALGREARQRSGPRPSRAALVAATCELLERCGYEPRRDETGIVLVNCPFHALARDFTDLVCHMNLDLLEGVAEGVGIAHFEPRFAPEPGRCCVRVDIGRRAPII